MSQYLPYVDGDFPAYLHAEKVNRFCLTDRWTFSLDHLSEMRSKVLEREPGTVPVKVGIKQEMVQ